MNILNDVVEEIVYAIMPKRFKVWFFSHNWPKVPTEYDIKYIRWMTSSSRRFNRRFSLMSIEEQNQVISALKKK